MYTGIYTTLVAGAASVIGSTASTAAKFMPSFMTSSASSSHGYSQSSPHGSTHGGNGTTSVGGTPEKSGFGVSSRPSFGKGMSMPTPIPFDEYDSKVFIVYHILVCTLIYQALILCTNPFTVRCVYHTIIHYATLHLYNTYT